MTLETVIAENTSAVRDLISQLKEANNYTYSGSIAPKPDLTITTEKTSKKASAPMTPKSSPPSVTTGEKPSDDITTVSLLDVQNVVSKMVRDEALALLTRYGAKSVRALPEDQLAPFHAEAKKILAGEMSALASDE